MQRSLKQIRSIGHTISAIAHFFVTLALMNILLTIFFIGTIVIIDTGNIVLFLLFAALLGAPLMAGIIASGTELYKTGKWLLRLG